MRKICFISTTRADYGLIYWLMKSVEADSEFELQIVVSGMHLEDKFGATWKKFEDDKFLISEKVSLGSMGDSRASIIKQVSNGVQGFGDAFNNLKPDLVVVVGDRYEMLSAAQAAFFLNIPIAHLAGGEVTEGAFDDSIRHAITKMSSYHFVATESYADRLKRMGEFPESILNIGAIGLENLQKVELKSKVEISNSLGFLLRDKNFLITYHPLTNVNEDHIDALLEALERFPDVGQIITMPNSDPGHSAIVEKLQKYAIGRENVHLSVSLGNILYPSLLAVSDVVIGNSSSGIVEAPFFGTSTVNIGTRQKGRIMASTIVNCDGDDIYSSIEKAIDMKRQVSRVYGNGNCSVKFIDFLKSNKFKVKRGFYDI